MNRLRLCFVTAIVASLMAGCSHDPLDGTWTASDNGGGTAEAATEAITFNADGTLHVVLTVTEHLGESCTGAFDFTGLTWTSTATAISIGGTAKCTSTLQCNGAAVPCDSSQSGSPLSGAINYTLSNNNDTLVLHIDGDDITFKRQD
jgi:hypothetical protein